MIAFTIFATCPFASLRLAFVSFVGAFPVFGPARRSDSPVKEFKSAGLSRLSDAFVSFHEVHNIFCCHHGLTIIPKRNAV
jgi:hypothetical protein